MLQFYARVPGTVEAAMNKFAELTGRRYRLFDYYGAPDAERVLVIMGSGADTARETADFLVGKGEKVGVVQVHLFLPFSAPHFLAALPATTKAIAVLDRTKEPGSTGEPMYTDVVTTFMEGAAQGTLPTAGMPRVIAGRYGLSSKEFSPGMVKTVLDELKKDKPKNHFTIGIQDDVFSTSLELAADFSTGPDDVFLAVFYGLDAVGTVGSNKNTMKIIGENPEFYA